ncbi:hypothetical protein HanXRQr2_Chr15g0692791 [Helianthus annuus]|uniref:Transmembrane protein n=1 Tax=Helianthus annuus TaxID=4232 RepID=A0A9K3H221_HELAN|nr:hypothetical protein HanXRQr2_Chr15g0692791 [Helianthus annuus]KAJ0451164.1 hypothetical protein HanHA300_Chr15g0564471 [Helianthus annuus]KAJ0473034.1 hypothetical protein HanHA89_Chr15g0613761 [Helianthus annuus]KAJ0648636.1 hypothetical protein HanLR1_Chr15g0575131 [Helianthus annuus]KAJ0652451.1 hypothetical protein HanOQP8_Chr15g0572301 [Helianthus annuus]
MDHFKNVLLCFIFAGILISGTIATRPIHMRVGTELEPKGTGQVSPAPAPGHHSLVLVESDQYGEGAEQAENHRHSSDKSVAGGGVIIGGLVTVTFAAVYCYIRVTRKRDDGN